MEIKVGAATVENLYICLYVVATDLLSLFSISLNDKPWKHMVVSLYLIQGMAQLVFLGAQIVEYNIMAAEQ